MEERAKNQLIQKEQILDTIEIAKAIVDTNLEGKKLTTKPEDFEHLDTYNIEIKDKLIKDFKEKYHKTPNLVLNDYIENYIEKRGLNLDFESSNFHFVGHVVNSHTWACITTKKKDPKIKERRASHYSQLYISINSYGIKFGFSYGHQVKNNNEIVNIVPEDQELRESLLKKVNESDSLEFYYSSDTPVLVESKDALVITNQNELKSLWNKQILITQNIFENNIPENISEQIESCFDELLDLFLKTSKIESVIGTLEHQCINILNEETETHSELNHDRILEILSLIINRMDEKGIIKTPKVVVLTAAVVWHNVLNRPGDNDHLMQSSLEEMLNGSLNATRYLRGELGIESRNYNNIEEFKADLEEEITVKRRKFKGSNDFPRWNDVKTFIIEEIIGRTITNETIISTSTFLYFNKERVFFKNELWEANKEFIDYFGDTPAATFNAELSRYSDNSDAQNKRTPLLFTITNLGERNHKLQLIPKIREIIDDFINQSELKSLKKLGESYNLTKVKKEYLSILSEVTQGGNYSEHLIETIDKISNLLIKNKQIILTGPPGTGKTYLAKLVAYQITKENENHIRLIQFHPEYCYENFIECLRIKSGSEMELESIPQIFRKLCERALNAKIKILLDLFLKETNEQEQIGFKDWYKNKLENELDFLSEMDLPKYVLIIDEINRGDLSRIFGEVIMGLEYRNTPIKTMYFEEEHPLIIPDNLFIIGTMNSVDRSIAILDYALRRRFLFYTLEPNRDILEDWLNKNDSQIKNEILDLFDRLNDEKVGWIPKTWKDSPHLAKNFQIGHTYFFHKSKEWLQTEWEYSIVPLLLEYMNFSNELIVSFKEEFDLKDPFK